MAKEAIGLERVRELLARDPRICFRKSPEGARSDFVVWRLGIPAKSIAVQHSASRPDSA